tara:strand:+ start:136 stop:342 length:207 start_codon:yes stop_codon:yes gene_type:complete
MKNLIITLTLVLFSTSAFAGSCPMMAKQVGDKIAQAQQLHDDAIAAHDSGDHTKSEELLNEALELFKS